MVVSFTPNIGLAKPDESEVAKNWVTVQNLHEDNKVIITNKMNLLAPQSYAATFIAPTTNPAVGSTGSITAEYYEFEGWVFGNFVIKIGGVGIGSGTGTGGYGISLPHVVNSTFHSVGGSLNALPGGISVVGEGYFSDASAVNTSGTVAFDLITIAGVSYVRPLPESYAGKVVRFVGPSAPVALADGDAMSGNFMYKKA
jgi:hypothetical protein